MSQMMRRFVRTRASSTSAVVEPGSGNVLADLGITDAVELDSKVRVAVEIIRLIEAEQLSNFATASLLNIKPADAVALKAYSLDGFSVESLTTYLARLRQGT